MIQKCTCVPESAVNAIPPYGGSNPPAPAPHSRSPETVPAGGKVPVFPGVCAPKSNTEIGDPAKKAGLARFGGPVSKGDFRISGFWPRRRQIFCVRQVSDFLMWRNGFVYRRPS